MELGSIQPNLYLCLGEVRMGSIESPSLSLGSGDGQICPSLPFVVFRRRKWAPFTILSMYLHVHITK